MDTSQATMHPRPAHPLGTAAAGGRAPGLAGVPLRAVLLYGLLIWIVPFVAAMLIYPVRVSDRPLFESIMPVVLTAVTVLAASRYFATRQADWPWGGALLGLGWAAVSIVLDLALFVVGPIQMPLLDYAKDIALTYLLIPAITIGFASLRRPAT